MGILIAFGGKGGSVVRKKLRESEKVIDAIESFLEPAPPLNRN
jgi:hypothetical protein